MFVVMGIGGQSNSIIGSIVVKGIDHVMNICIIVQIIILWVVSKSVYLALEFMYNVYVIYLILSVVTDMIAGGVVV